MNAARTRTASSSSGNPLRRTQRQSPYLFWRRRRRCLRRPGAALLSAAATLLLSGCISTSRGDVPLRRADALATAATVTQSIIERHTRELAADRYEGRFPGTDGERLSLAYLEREFRRIGLAPGNPDGTYVQRLQLLGQRSTVSAGLRLGGGTTQSLAVPADAAFAVTNVQPVTRLTDSELLFVGYGISAPEYGWDDYDGVDVRGKTVLVLRGEPGRPVGSDPGAHDPSFFLGDRLTYHGIVERKWEVARARGAAAIVLVSPGLPGFRNHVARSGGEYLMRGRERWPGVVGFFGPAVTDRIFTSSGRTFADAMGAAGRRGFKALSLGSSLSLEIATSWRHVTTHNAVARLEGTAPRLRHEHVVVSAHWDAFGVGPAVDGDSIYNGAVDDAVGVGQMLAVAEALARDRRRLQRSVLFLVTTAEEHNLAGARGYLAAPLYPIADTVLNVNFDVVSLAGATRDVTLYGAGRSSLDAELERAAALQDRSVSPERTPDSDIWFRQDHFAFVEAGVPALTIAAGTDVIGQPVGFAERLANEYEARRYHRPSDEVGDDWNWGSVVQDAQLGVILALRAAGGGARLAWKDRREFRQMQQ